MHIIIDGYNLIRQSDFFRQAERISLEVGRNRLIQALIGYNKARSHKITVVFDGWMDGSSREEHRREGSIQIVYSRRGERADEVIKRMSRTGGSDVLVVSSDREVARYATRSGVTALSSPQFEIKLRDRCFEPSPRDGIRDEDDDDGGNADLTARKKGPARKPSKRERKTARALKKL